MDVWDWVIIIVVAGLAIGWVVEQVGDAWANTAGQPELSMAVMDVQPGDTLVVTPGVKLTVEQMRHLKHILDSKLPEGARALVVDPGTTMHVVRPAQEGASA